MYDFEDVNRVLAELAHDNMVEPIDEPDCHPMDFADVTGLFDEIYPEPQEMVDDGADDFWYDDGDESMDGDHDSAMESAGWGTDEDYGYYGEDF